MFLLWAGLPDVMKPFFLYVHERLRTAVGILTQLLGSWHHLVAYLSKQLDAVSWTGHPACTSWWPPPSWWQKQTNLLWNENSQSKFSTLFWLLCNTKEIIVWQTHKWADVHVTWKPAYPNRG
jgi:hypothetical protein